MKINFVKPNLVELRDFWFPRVCSGERGGEDIVVLVIDIEEIGKTSFCILAPSGFVFRNFGIYSGVNSAMSKHFSGLQGNEIERENFLLKKFLRRYSIAWSSEFILPFLGPLFSNEDFLFNDRDRINLNGRVLNIFSPIENSNLVISHLNNKFDFFRKTLFYQFLKITSLRIGYFS